MHDDGIPAARAPARPDSFLIEIEEEALGLAVADQRGGVTFHAVHPRAQPLHGRRFADTVDATRAARSVSGGVPGKKRRKPPARGH